MLFGIETIPATISAAAAAAAAAAEAIMRVDSKSCCICCRRFSRLGRMVERLCVLRNDILRRLTA